MKQKIVLGAGCLLSGFFLYKVYTQINVDEMLAALGSFNLLWLPPCLFLFYLSMYLRAVRWALFFRPNYQLTGSDLWRPTMIGFGFNSFLPGRVGEFIRAILVGRKYKTGFPTAMATIVTERLFDSVTLLGSLGIALAMLPPIDPSMTVEFWGFTMQGSQLGPLVLNIEILCGVMILGVGMFMIPAVPKLCIRIVFALPGLPHGIRLKLEHIIEGVARGLESVRDLKTFAMIVFYSLAIWFLIAASNLVLAWGFVGLEEMNLLHSIAIVALVAVAIVVPAAPGYWGLFEVGVLFSLVVLGITEDQSIGAAYAITMHLVQWAPVVAIGLYYSAREQVSVGAMKAEAGGEAPGAK